MANLPLLPTDGSARVTIAATPSDTISVDLVGERYEINPPKMFLALRIGVAAKNAGNDMDAMLSALTTWIEAAMGRQATEVLERLEDPDDDLDLMHIMRLMEKITEVQTSDPTS